MHDFFIKYQDRLIYATDLGSTPNSTTDEVKKKIHTEWLNDWEFFVTNNVMTTTQFEGKFKGLHLPKEVIENIQSECGKWVPWFKEMNR